MHDAELYLSVGIFLITYICIAADRIPPVYPALAGGGLMIWMGIVSQEETVKRFIDFNTIGLLLGMMIIVSIVRMSGFFEMVAIWAVKVTGGRPYQLMILLAGITAVGAAALDSVTAILLLAPVTISLCRRMKMSPYPFLLMEILMSNIGGTALMIGNPPNVMIGSAARLDFNAFLLNLAPAVLLSMAVILTILCFVFRNQLHGNAAMGSETRQLDPSEWIRNRVLLRRSLSVLLLTICGFALHGVLNIQPATIALSGAVAAMFICRIEPGKAFRAVDWETLFFFMGLFVLVGGLEVSGAIGAAAAAGAKLAAGDPETMTFFILWFSGIVSAFVDNIPFTAAMIPLIRDVQSLLGVQADYMWWSLALGACYGGNGTLIGASPNIIAAAIYAKEGGHISFIRFMKLCFPLMLISILVCHIYIYVRYFVF